MDRYFYTYLLRCRDGTYYAGHTDDLDQRMAQHTTGDLGGYTSRRMPVTLVWSDRFLTRDEAFAAERKLKGWSRAKKDALIAGDWDLISQLARKQKVGLARHRLAILAGPGTARARSWKQRYPRTLRRERFMGHLREVVGFKKGALESLERPLFARDSVTQAPM